MILEKMGIEVLSNVGNLKIDMDKDSDMATFFKKNKPPEKINFLRARWNVR